MFRSYLFRSYLAVALGNLANRKLETALNVLGLAIGLASCLLISLFVRYELGYESNFADAQRIFRISRDYFPRDGARARVPASINAPVAPALLADFPQVAHAGRVFGSNVLLGRGNELFREPLVRFADNGFLDVFDFHWVRGNGDDALSEPFTLVLTESLARKYFGDADPLGQTLTLNGSAPLRVTGVIGDLPGNTHLRFSGLISLQTLVSAFGPQMLEQWNSMTDFHTYFRLRPAADIETIEAGIPAFMARRISEEAAALSGMTIMTIADIHLRSDRDEEWRQSGSLATVYSFSAIALGILLIACVNFMNLSTARASQRAREVAVRKAVGATRRQLVGQFLGESMLVAALAMLVAMSLVEILLPTFSNFIGARLTFDYSSDPAMMATVLGLTLLVGLVAGSYPAFYLSAFQPARVLKGEVHRGGGSVAFRNVLVVAQFAIAIALLICLTVVNRQAAHARGIDLGFEKDRVVILSGSTREGLGAQWSTFKQQLTAHPGIAGVTASHYTPFTFDDNQLSVRRPGETTVNRIQYMGVGLDFFRTYGIDVLAGRVFSEDFPRDAFAFSAGAGSAAGDFQAGPGVPGQTPGVVVNAAAARALGWSPGEAVGQTLQVGVGESASLSASLVGVVNDTHFESVRVAVRPMIYVLARNLQLGESFHLNHAAVRVRQGSQPAALAHIDATWQALMPGQPLARRFLDDDFEAMYQDERRQEVLLGWFSGLAIVIACVGLFGLAAFSAERRTREIGVRKALGGSVASIVMLLTNDFGKLVLGANLLAWPLAYFIMRDWLDNFAYRIDLGPLVFLGASLAALGLAWLTVAGIAARAASANPVHALRYE